MLLKKKVIQNIFLTLKRGLKEENYEEYEWGLLRD